MTIRLKNHFTLLFLSLLSLYFLVFCNSCRQNNKNNELIIFHAGSLAVPMKAFADTFRNTYDDIKIMMESAGSRECARKITELGKPCDIIATSDYEVIKEMLMPKFASWYIVFAGNEMCIAFNENSGYQDVITAGNWPEILLRKEITSGRSDPANDPCGYRTLMLFQLAEKYYKMPGFAKKMEEQDIEYMRPKEVDLLALLESKSLDYIFIYRSVAVQHHLKYLVLPDEINLGTEKYASQYSIASVEINDKAKKGKIVLKGEPVFYAVSIPNNAPHKDIALRFVEMMLSEKGKRILQTAGQNAIVWTDTSLINKIPEPLQKYLKK